MDRFLVELNISADFRNRKFDECSVGLGVLTLLKTKNN